MRLLKAAGLFMLVCAMGLFCAAAGGIEWGTSTAGYVAFLTLYIASSAAWIGTIK